MDSPAEASSYYRRWLVALLLITLGATCLALIMLNHHHPDKVQ